MGLFGFGRGRQAFGYERRRAGAAPDGWVTAPALVSQQRGVTITRGPVRLEG